MFLKDFSNYLAKLEATSSRLEMTRILAELFKKSASEEIDKVCYLVLGELAPKYEGVELMMAEKMMIRAVSQSVSQPIAEVTKIYKQIGDLGDTINNLKSQISNPKTTTQNSKLTIIDVYQRLTAITQDSGQGSVGRKISKMASLLSEVDPLSAKYLARIPVNKLRLGFSEMTILDSLSWMVNGDKSLRPELERAFNVLADIGKIAKTLCIKGIKGIKGIKSEVGVPIRAAKAERLPDAQKILEKMSGQCVLEPKYDGFRVQIHLNKLKAQSSKLKATRQNLKLFTSDKKEALVRIFSRNLDNTTEMFPDIVQAVQKLNVKNIILDGEAIAFDPKTGKFLPFQETVQRKRKYGIEEKAKNLPLKVFIFDLLMLNNQSLLQEPFSKRRKLLEEVFRYQSQKYQDRPPATLKHPPSLKLRRTSLRAGLEVSDPGSEKIVLTEQKIVSRVEEFDQFFTTQVNEGLEGLMAKKLDAVYQAGARNFNWVKYKAGMQSKLADTIDCIVMGYYFGKGKRTGFGIGAFLVGVMHKEKILTVSKIGTGLTDEQWRELRVRCEKWKVREKPGEYLVHKNLSPDVWCRPELVVEIEADTITKSPIHTAGLALRFPRLKRFRDDKNPDQATSLSELRHLTKK